jgi:tRNA pseudouridine38-40 synthase
VRTVYRCECREIFVNAGPSAARTSRVLEIRVAADGFLPRMVRNIAGAFVEIGQGRRDAQWLQGVLDARDRRAGSVLAPARGLTLWKIGYGDDLLQDW